MPKAKVLNVYRGDGLNLYAYVKNNPVMWIDPSGYNKCSNTADVDDNAPKVVSVTEDGVKILDNGNRIHTDGSIRTADGKFAGTTGTIPGSVAVENFVNSVNDGTNTDYGKYTVVGQEISVRDGDGRLRRYDVVLESNNQFTGIEIKSGSASRTKQQLEIDNALNANNGFSTVGQRATDARIPRIDTAVEVKLP